MYFEPVTTEDVLQIYEKEKPFGVIVQFGGQTPLNIARELQENGVNILGTSIDSIDIAEDRDLFRHMMEKLEIPMPESGMAIDFNEAKACADKIGYPIMIRPSFVLGGRGMEVIYDEATLKEYVEKAVGVTPDRPLLIDLDNMLCLQILQKRGFSLIMETKINSRRSITKMQKETQHGKYNLCRNRCP